MREALSAQFDCDGIHLNGLTLELAYRDSDKATALNTFSLLLQFT